MKTSMDEPICRICLETNGILFSPCLCNGTIKYVHETCLDTWRKLSINVLSSSPIFIFIGMTIITKDIAVLNINLLAFIIIVTGNYNIIRVIDSISHKRILSL